MSSEARRAEAQPEDGIETAGQGDWDAMAPASDYVDMGEWAGEPEPMPAPWGPRILAAILVLLALAWIGAVGWSNFRDLASAPTIDFVLQIIVAASAPLILLGLVWMLFGRSGRRETERFTRAVTAMRGESAALEGLLGMVAARLEENHARLTQEAGKLMTLGDEASDRLGRVTLYLARESAVLDRRAKALETAAEAARVDIGVMLADLPRAEEQTRSFAEALRDTGLAAHAQAGTLEGQLSALVARGREADEVAGGAAQRLASHLARIETNTGAAAARIDEAAAGMTAAVDGTMAHAAEAVDAARSGVAEQGAALLAMIEQSRAAFEIAGDDTGRSLSTRLDEIGAKVQDLASHLAAQDAASQSLVGTLARDLGALEIQFATLGETGRGNSESIGAAIEGLRVSVDALQGEMAGGDERAAALIGRTQALAEGLAGVSGQLSGEVSNALAQVEEQAGRTRAAAVAIVPKVQAVQASADASAATLAEAEASVARQREALESMLALINEGVAAAEEKLQSLAAAVGEADAASARIVGETGPELVEAMVRVRETATQAAERAREAIAAVIPQSAAALAEASKRAVGEAISGQVIEQMGEIGLVAERAVEAARKASERLTRQMLTIGETANALEMRIDEVRREREERDRDGFSRRVALLIESLNSTAIDVTKILSNEVTDSAWSAYLKGDRGVFTRRAVRLLDTHEAREIVQHYEAEPEFRDQVNRYIHDFESMLRRVLADREGSALGVTILSSDMGKLYVALAQAIERLRT